MFKKYEVRKKVSNDLVEQLLHNRGIVNSEEKTKFLNPDFDSHLHDPFLLPDMEKAVERVLRAIDKGDRVAVWSDYDADGIPGGALLHDFFKLIGFNNFINYIPDRHNEGYGLNIEGIDGLKAENVKLIITVDCGIRDFKPIARAKELGMEVIVTDHHEPASPPAGGLPEAFAIVNHKRADSKYPEQVLCGTGVAWKFVQALLSKRREFAKDGSEKWLLDLAGIATLSDMVPLTGENRAIAYFGLKVLRKTRRPGLQKLYSILRMNRDSLTEDDIAFLITPRINAASRMGKPRDAFELLTTVEYGKGEALARHLDAINQERKGVVAGIVREAKKIIENNLEKSTNLPVIVVGNPEWRPALLGLAANTIAEEYNRPVFMWGRGGSDEIKGSCRSDGVTDLVALMERASSNLLEFGGHKMSGGFSVSNEMIHTLEDAFINASLDFVNKKDERTLSVDAELKIKDVNETAAQVISRLAPFGIGNEKPTFIFANVIAKKVNRFGRGKEHVEVVVEDGKNSARAISFFSTPESWGKALQEGRSTNLVASIEKSSFGGRNEIRLRIVDFF